MQEEEENKGGGFLGCLQGTIAIFLLAYGLYILTSL